MRRFLAGLALAFIATAALAQADAHPTPSWVDALMAQLIPYVAVALGTALTALVGILVTYINRWGKKIGVDIDATQAAKLNQALTNAAGGLIQKLGPDVAMRLAPGHPEVQAYAARVATGLADALRDLKVDPNTVPQRILEKVPQVLPVDAPAAVVAVPAPKPSA